MKMNVFQRILRSPYFFAYSFMKNILWRNKVYALIKSGVGINLHLGCGDRHINDFLNCEYRPTKAADVVMDCGDLSRFRSDTVGKIFSHAFLEHLYRPQQLPLFMDCFRVLKNNGIVIFLGIPDFEVIARNYLAQTSGVRGGGVFDLYNVYRYTHGDPEISPTYWLEQLHKSLFDKDLLSDLLTNAGFNSFIIFNYCYPNEIIPLNLGFIAQKSSNYSNYASIIEYLMPYKEYVADIDSIIITKQSGIYF